MSDNLSAEAKRAIELANAEAQRFNHEYIGTEHILLSLIKLDEMCPANIVLQTFEVTAETIRKEIERLIQAGPTIVSMGKLPVTPRARKVLEYAVEEARRLQHQRTNTAHILLGLLRENEGIAGQVLIALGLKLEDTREEVKRIHSDDEPEEEVVDDDAIVAFELTPPDDTQKKKKKRRRLRVRFFIIDDTRPGKLRIKEKEIEDFLKGVKVIRILSSSFGTSSIQITVVYRKKKKRPK